MIGCLSAFQPNQIVQITRDLAFLLCTLNILLELFNDCHRTSYFSGLKRIADVSLLVPFMALLYLASVMVAILLNADLFLPSMQLIFRGNGEAAVTGGIAGVIITVDESQ